MNKPENRPVTPEDFADAFQLVRKGPEYAGACPLCGGSDRFHVGPGSRHGAVFGCRNCMDGKNPDVKRERQIEVFRMLRERLQSNQSRPAVKRAEPLPKKTEAKQVHMPTGDHVQHWTYTDEKGRPIVRVYRTHDEKRGKSYSTLTVDPDGTEWTGKLGEVRKLYNLKALSERPDAPVILVEGEKTAECQQAKKLAQTYNPPAIVTTWIGGVPGGRKTDLSPLAGRKVLLCPDNDGPGLTAMAVFAEKLKDMATISCLPPPSDAPPKWDLADATNEQMESIISQPKKTRDFSENGTFYFKASRSFGPNAITSYAITGNPIDTVETLPTKKEDIEKLYGRKIRILEAENHKDEEEVNNFIKNLKAQLSGFEDIRLITYDCPLDHEWKWDELKSEDLEKYRLREERLAPSQNLTIRAKKGQDKYQICVNEKPLSLDSKSQPVEYDSYDEAQLVLTTYESQFDEMARVMLFKLRETQQEQQTNKNVGLRMF